MTNQAKDLILYHYWRSSCSWRVRWALALKELAYVAVAVNLLKQEQQDASFLAKSPAGLVPCLVYQGRAYFESIPMIEWLDETFAAHPILAKDPERRYQERALAALIHTGVQPLANLKVLAKVSDDAAVKKEWSQFWIRQGLQAYQNALPKGGSKTLFSLGNHVSLADICLVPQIYNAKRQELDLRPFARLTDIYDAALASPACHAAAPDRFEPKP